METAPSLANSSQPLQGYVPRPLLSKAVTSRSARNGDYTWRILDSPLRLCEFETLVEVARSSDTYVETLRAGCDALPALCVDPLVGPVQDGQAKDSEAGF